MRLATSWYRHFPVCTLLQPSSLESQHTKCSQKRDRRQGEATNLVGEKVSKDESPDRNDCKGKRTTINKVWSAV
ncbi:hypothetical protein K474DRAFT_1198844 [Panus rudis PR-1116 ss-1]|nr:hypothetical protein K474DRAFT_1198844 [Panus rudis PR-1116 ss-1]